MMEEKNTRNMDWLQQAKKEMYDVYVANPEAYFRMLEEAGQKEIKRRKSIHRLSYHIWE